MWSSLRKLKMLSDVFPGADVVVEVGTCTRGVLFCVGGEVSRPRAGKASFPPLSGFCNGKMRNL